MGLDLSGRQVFVASPGGLEHERALLRTTVEDYNRKTAHHRGVAFIERGWEQRIGGVGRPQSLINEILVECDYTVVLLADRWGSPPGDSEYTSGTEEEFFLSLDLLSDPNANMRDVLVLFRSVPAAQLGDPGAELSKVVAFKQRLQLSKKILYKTFDSDRALQEHFEAALSEWEKEWQPRVPQRIELPVLVAPTPQGGDPDLLARALELAESQQLVQAESVFAKAARGEEPRVLAEYARFLRRQGRLSDSIGLNERVVNALASNDRRSDVDTEILADALANLGVINRKRGNLADSVRQLSESVVVARSAREPLPKVGAYALDNLGHTQSLMGQQDEAAESFAAAAKLRASLPEPAETLQTLLNSGWSDVRRKEFQTAREAFEDAERIARATDDSDSLAKALTGLGNCMLSLDDVGPAVDALTEALAINRRAKASDGIGMTAGLLARAHLTRGDVLAAEEAAREVLTASQESSNVVGMATANWRLAAAARLDDRDQEADALFGEAVLLARESRNPGLLAAIERDYADTWSQVREGQ